MNDGYLDITNEGGGAGDSWPKMIHGAGGGISPDWDV